MAGGGRTLQGGDHHDLLVGAAQGELQTHPRNSALGIGHQAAVIGGAQQVGIGITQGGQHALDGFIGVNGTADRPLQGLLAQPLPMHRIKALRIHVALIHQPPGLHNYLLGIAEGGGGRGQPQPEAKTPGQQGKAGIRQRSAEGARGAHRGSALSVDLGN